jgi:hypothetical protein
VLRWITTLWFAIYSLLGPGICCCTLLASPEKPSEGASKTKKCCCSTEAVGKGSEHPRQHCPPDHCPCKRLKAEAKPLEPVSNLASPFHSSWFELLPDLSNLSASGSSLLNVHDGNPSQLCLPFVTTEALLRAFHIMRC